MDRSALKEKIAQFPREPGVYLMKDDAGVVIYIGKAKSLRNRVAAYFQEGARHEEKTARMLRSAADVDFVEAPSEVDAFLMESRLVKDVQPKYNVRLRDSKTFPFLQITTGEDYPRVEITRNPAPGARLFGPFTSAHGLRASLGILQKVFRFRTCSIDIRDDDDQRRYARPCLLYHIKSCLGPCAALCRGEVYDASVRNLMRFLSGRRDAAVKDLERRMLKASREMRFEEAAGYRDEAKALKSLDARSHFTDNPAFYDISIDFKAAGRALAETFELAEPPRVIEGIDISNLEGSDAVGSVVTFIDGAPWKSGYRRYKIRTVDGSDDYRMIAEVVTRRYGRLLAEETPLPDLILIDGGKGQLRAASEALGSLGVTRVLVVSIAKREEELYTPGRDEPVHLARRNTGLRLLQYVRDEAHRFALHYHHILRTGRVLAPRSSRRRTKRVNIELGSGGKGQRKK